MYYSVCWVSLASLQDDDDSSLSSNVFVWLTTPLQKPLPETLFLPFPFYEIPGTRLFSCQVEIIQFVKWPQDEENNQLQINPESVHIDEEAASLRTWSLSTPQSRWRKVRSYFLLLPLTVGFIVLSCFLWGTEELWDEILFVGGSTKILILIVNSLLCWSIYFFWQVCELSVAYDT